METSSNTSNLKSTNRTPTTELRNLAAASPATVNNLKILIWSGPICVIMVFFGLFLMAGFFPPPSPKLTGEQMADVWKQGQHLKQAGMVICFIGGTLYATFSLAIGFLLQRCSNDLVMPIAQTVLGVFGTVYFSFNFLILATAGFRPGLALESTQVLHDLGFIMTFSPAAPFFLQYFAIAIIIFQIPDKNLLVPRWLAYFNLWVGMGLIPASFIPLFHSGPFAWDGVFGFYIPVLVFGAWFIVMVPYLLKLVPSSLPD